MNRRALGWLVGRVLLLLAVFQLVPALVGFGYGEVHAARGCLISAALSALFGAVLVAGFRGGGTTREGRADYFRREGLCAVGLSWLAAAAFGALPFLFSGVTGSLASAVFEATSGFTTTGGTAFTAGEIDALPHAITFWRALTHWLGGIGIVLVFVLLFPAGGRSLFRSEVSGISREATRARVRDSAFGLVRVYVFLTALHALCLWWIRHDVFDAVVHAMSTLATGGFSNHGASVAFFGSWKAELVIALFMFLAGVNFDVYDTVQRQGLRAGWRAFAGSSEVRLYAGLTAGSTLFIGLTLWFWGGGNGAGALPDYSHIGLAFKDSFFNVVNVQSCTGYATADYDRWPDTCRVLLVMLMAVGACAGSTGGGLKVVRVLVLWKGVRQAMARFARPRAIEGVRLDGNALEDEAVSAVTAYVGLWLLCVASGVLVVLWLGAEHPDFPGQAPLTALTGVVASLSNCGPGLAAVGPCASYGFLPPATKFLLSFLMLLGRLEFAALFVVLMPKFWRA